MTKFQENYASKRPQMYDRKSRQRKALRIIRTLQNYFGKGKLASLSLLDIGSSTGIIDHILSKYFKTVTGVDMDNEAVSFAKRKFRRKNLSFRIANALNLPLGNSSFDVIVCTHIYEHVPDSKKLMNEIHRVLKRGGVCYFAAVNRLWPIEPHHNLPFLSFLPKTLANLYVRTTGKASHYYETPYSYWGLKKLTSRFRRIEYTQKILQSPNTFGYEDTIPFPISILTRTLSPALKYFSPTFFWILVKD